eukprot:g29779.t1
MRSCFPDFKAGKRQIKSVSAYVVQHGETEDEPETGLAFEADGPDSVVFDEVEAFLTEHGFQDTTSSSSPPEVFDEAEVAEVLAATWPEKRTEISKLQKARKFKQAASMKKQFSKDLTDIQKRSRCRRCGQIGHWASSCPQNSGTSGQNDKEKVSGAAMVTEEVYLVSSPGYGIMDSGCSRTLIGQQTLGDFMRMYQDRKMSVPESRPQQNLFRFGNGQEELSERVMSMPVIIRGQSQFMQGPTRALTRREHRCLMAHHETWSKEKKSTCAAGNPTPSFMRRVQVSTSTRKDIPAKVNFQPNVDVERVKHQRPAGLLVRLCHVCFPSDWYVHELFWNREWLSGGHPTLQIGKLPLLALLVATSCELTLWKVNGYDALKDGFL